MRDVKAKVGLSCFFSNSPCLYLMFVRYCLWSPKGEWEMMSHLLPILLVLFFFSLGRKNDYSSCIFIRMSLPLCSSCAYLVLSMATYVYFGASCIILHLSDIWGVTTVTIHIVNICLAIKSQCYKEFLCCLLLYFNALKFKIKAS